MWPSGSFFFLVLYKKTKTKVHRNTKKVEFRDFFSPASDWSERFSRRVIVFPARGTPGRHTDLACDTVVLRGALA